MMKLIFVLAVFCVAGSYSASLERFKRQNLGYGGGVSFTYGIDPFNTRNPVNAATNVAFGYGVDAAGTKQSNAINFSNTIGNGLSSGNAVGGARDGFAFGGGNANTRVLVPGGNFVQGGSNNFGFSGSSGNGMGFGNARGGVMAF